MTGRVRRLPDGYVRFAAGACDVVALAPEAAAVRDAIRSGSLLAYAEYEARTGHTPVAVHRGRGAVYAVPLPRTGTRVVVRRARHGGFPGRLAGDRFLATRAWRELHVARRLREVGVPTPEVVAFAVHPRNLLWVATDVATRELPPGSDLAAVLAAEDPELRARALPAVRRLLHALADAGARHPDLNAKNVYIVAHPAPGDPTAYVLDVDRVRFTRPACARTAGANARRLARSLRKLRERAGVPVRDDALRAVHETAACA